VDQRIEKSKERFEVDVQGFFPGAVEVCHLALLATRPAGRGAATPGLSYPKTIGFGNPANDHHWGFVVLLNKLAGIDPTDGLATCLDDMMRKELLRILGATLW
jgi:hypothetical protein